MNIIEKWTQSSLILKIIIGLIIGALLGVAFPNFKAIGFFGEIFVSALKAIAPILVFVLVASAISSAKNGIGSRFKTVIIFYLLSTFLAAMVAVTFSFIFPVSVHLSGASTAAVPGGLDEIISGMVLNVFSNPIESLSKGDYLGILFWAIISGIALRDIASSSTKNALNEFAKSTSKVVSEP